MDMALRTPPAALGGIDGISPDGHIMGWAWQPGSAERSHIKIIMGDEILAEALADWFREDLLRAGMGLGHCAFFARPHVRLEPGEYLLELVDARLDVVIGPPGGRLVIVPDEDADEATLDFSPRVAWNDDEVLEALEHFDLTRQWETLGTARFVDAVFRFVLGRWADDDGMQGYVRALETGELAPEEFFRIILSSDERQAMRTPLPSPFDYRFPFKYPSSRRRRAPQPGAGLYRP